MSKELQVGLIGTGAIGRSHVERINTVLQGARVVAVSDTNTDFGKQVADELGLEFFARPEDLILSRSVEAVVIAASDEHHEPCTIAAVDAGKYVFCEKPLAPTSEGARKVVDAEIAAGRKLVQVGFMRRYDPGYVQMKEVIDSGRLGAPLMIHCCHRNAAAPGFTTDMSVENSMIHEIDVLRWLLGEDYTTAEVVFPRKTRHTGDEFRDPQIMYLTTTSGIRIDVESFLTCRYGYDVRCEVVCEEGTVSLPEPANAMLRTGASRVYPICEDWSQRFPEAYNLEFQAWINATKEGRVDGPTAWDGYVAAVTATAASQARDAGNKTVVNLDDRPSFYDREN